MTVLAILSGLFGCGNKPKYKGQHSVSEITRISMSCSHMDYNYGYSFQLFREGNQWMFDAHCCTDNFEKETEFYSKQVSSTDIDTLFEILERNNTISYIETYKKPKKLLKFQVMDETVYGFCLSFSDGSSYNTDSAGSAISELQEFFYSLAEK
ncbi:MAG: hypothetical protein ACI4RN_07500 [Oscillospiraceae bacterium]